ncbi:MAG: SDR family NAD(P)-dependent oxidoreductase, partial [Pseudomonadota bacterium]
IFPVPCDVADRKSVKDAAEAIRARFGKIGLVVSNAGVYLPIEAPHFSATLFKRTFDINVIGAAHLMEEVLPDMSWRHEGHVHFVSSATGFGGMPTASAYGASKAALINMAECLKIELERDGVGISLSTPGFVETPAQDDNTFPKPFMIQPSEAAMRIADAVMQGGFERTFPRRFTWMLKAIYALPKFMYLPLVRIQTGWNKPSGERKRPN